MTRRRLTDALTSLAAQTFPPTSRADGRVVRDCARDAIDAAGLRAMVRETVSVAVAGLRVRYRVSVRDVSDAPWLPALGALTLPLAAAFLCVWTFGFAARYDHWPLGEGWALLLIGAALCLPRRPVRSVAGVGGRLVLGLLPTAFPLLHVLPAPRPEPRVVMTHVGPGQEPVLSGREGVGNPGPA